MKSFLRLHDDGGRWVALKHLMLARLFKLVSPIALACTFVLACANSEINGRPSADGKENSAVSSHLAQEIEAKKLALLGKTHHFYAFVKSHQKAEDATSRLNTFNAVDIYEFGQAPNRQGVRIGLAINSKKLCIDEKVLLAAFESQIGVAARIQSIKAERVTPATGTWTPLEISRKGVFAYRTHSAERISVVAEFSIFGLKCLDAIHFTHEP